MKLTSQWPPAHRERVEGRLRSNLIARPTRRQQMTEIPPGAPEVTGHLIIEPIMGPVSILKHQHHQPPLGHGLDKRRPGCEHIAAAVANGLPTAAWNAEQHV